MGQYRLVFVFGWSLAIGITYEKEFWVNILLPFLTIKIGLTYSATGVSVNHNFWNHF
jgi:hypothetical protein